MAHHPAPHPTPRQRALPEVSARCTGCGRCVAACPPQVLWLQVENWVKRSTLHDAAACTGCARCVPVCPFDAIRMVRPGTLGSKPPAADQPR